MAEIVESGASRYRISDLILEADTRRVLRNGEPLALGALTFEFLLALAEASPAMVTYERFAERVWQGRRVTPETIAQRAKMLRQALSDDAKSPRYVELVRGQGYRLIPEVTRIAAPPASTRTRRRWLGAAAALALVAALGFGATKFLAPAGTPSSVAVLPFTDLSPNGDQQHLGDGIAEELINELAALDGLDVASRTESFFFRGPTSDIRDIGRKLRVATVLEGSVRKARDQIRITVQLIEVDSGYHLWSEVFDGSVDDIFAVQESIAASVAGALGVKLGVGGVNAFVGAGTTNFEAYEAYLRGESERALRLDPGYAAAWGDRGVQIASTMYRHPPEDAPAIIAEAYEHVARALELDPGSAAANTRFATLIYTTWDWKRAEEAFAEALSLRRNTGDLYNYANMLMRTGRTRRALEMHLEREEMLLPLEKEPASLLRLNVELALGRQAVAETLIGDGNEIRARNQRLMLALNSGSKEDLRIAMQGMRDDRTAYQEFFGPLLAVFDSREDAIQLMKDVANDPNRAWPSRYSNVGMMAAFFGEPELAFEILEREIRHTPIRFGILWYPLMSDVRKLAEFRQFVTDVGLVDYWREYGWSDFCRPLGNEDFVCE